MQDKKHELRVLMLDAATGFYRMQRYRVGDGSRLAGLQRLLKIAARMCRGAKETDIPAEEVVSGDIVLLESGNKVPTDLCLVEVNSLAAELKEKIIGMDMRVPVPNGSVTDITVSLGKDVTAEQVNGALQKASACLLHFTKTSRPKQKKDKQ